MEQVTMGRSRILVANWYDYPEYYDIAFQARTSREADLIEAVCRKYCPFVVRHLLEPACGTGRLVTALAGRGYRVTAFDISLPALNYLRRQLVRRRLCARTFAADMADFGLRRSADAAYCLINTFRHLLTEQAAHDHLECIAENLRPGGIYVLGMDLLPLYVQRHEAERWTRRRRKTTVTVTHRVLSTDLRRRTENVQFCVLVRHGLKELRLRHEFQLRTYTPKQFRRLLTSVPSLELCDIYDFWYDIDQPLAPNDQIDYGVFVLRRRLSL
jgi:SAM-dependent methyltransferase